MILYLVLIIIVLAIVDILQTNKILSMSGVEKNPFNIWFMAKLGKWWWTPKMFITLIVLVGCIWYQFVYGIIAFGVVQLAIVVWNCYVYIKVRKEGDSKTAGL